MEWSAFASECRSRGLLEYTDCDAARRSRAHDDEEGCLCAGEYARARPGRVGSEPSTRPTVILSADEALAQIGDEMRDYGAMSMLDRIELLGVCVSGLCNSPSLRGVRAAYDAIAVEGLIEQMGGSPSGGGWLDEPNGLVQAFSVIRSTRNEIQARNLKAAQSGGKPPQELMAPTRR